MVKRLYCKTFGGETSGCTGENHVVTARVPHDLYDGIHLLSEKAHVTVTEIVVRALDDKLMEILQIAEKEVLDDIS